MSLLLFQVKKVEDKLLEVAEQVSVTETYNIIKLHI